MLQKSPLSGRRRSFGAARRFLVIGVAWLGALVLLVDCTPLTLWWARAYAGRWNDPSGDTLIVLSAEALPDGVIGQSSYWRCVYALRAFRGGHFRRILITGGPIPGGGEPVASIMRDFIVASGVPASAVEVEVRSRTTHESAVNVAQMLRGVSGSKAILTSDYHMWRASRCFRAVGMPVLLRPIPDAVKLSGTWSGRWPAFCELVKESAKIVYYRAKGWI